MSKAEGRTTKIRWTKHTWNPTTGCTKVSPGCDNCYAERIARDVASYSQTVLSIFGGASEELDYDWFRQIRDICKATGTAYFHKQGNHYYSDRDTELDGETFDEYPEVGGGLL